MKTSQLPLDVAVARGICGKELRNGDDRRQSMSLPLASAAASHIEFEHRAQLVITQYLLSMGVITAVIRIRPGAEDETASGGPRRETGRGPCSQLRLALIMQCTPGAMVHCQPLT